MGIIPCKLTDHDVLPSRAPVLSGANSVSAGFRRDFKEGKGARFSDCEQRWDRASLAPATKAEAEAESEPVANSQNSTPPGTIASFALLK